ncbi:hypothetical protein BURPS1106B_A1284 [Burkholderia pseudomallei 1106b]|uniref:Uncharacterized protein n=1 Tax=Burkholderia pseudomallei (strain 1106a) TaxID=357348 RepID=A3NVE1_BURP0|nr:hypothetical protein BURPS1106A_2047 [Burkholderia pseudomallei 1106a]EES23810.1 hypothetical protein BURPS1106B_A1284 [Burkholderia pseudomallei 1106b]
MTSWMQPLVRHCVRCHTRRRRDRSSIAAQVGASVRPHRQPDRTATRRLSTTRNGTSS